MIQGRALKRPRQEIWMHFPTCNGWEVWVNAGRVWGKKYEVPVNVVFPYIAVSQRVLQGGTGERAEGAAGLCGRLRESLDHVYSAGGNHRGRSKIPEVWEYASGSSPDGSIVCHMRRKINILFFPVTFCSLFLLGHSCLWLMCKPTVKERMSMQPAGTVGAIGIGKGMNSQVL